MMTIRLSVVAAALALLALPAHSRYQLAAYFVNWAQYRQAPYGPYTPTELQPVLPDLDVLLYGFAYFDHTTEQLMPVEQKDPQFMQQIVQMKRSANPNLKVAVSIGGWNFNSADFSRMVASNSTRAAFIKSAIAYTAQYNLDGIDLDWEYPCSPPRTDYVKFSCDNIQPHEDAGGKCPDDTDNFLYLVQELRRAAPQMWVSVASQAAKENYGKFRLKEMAAAIDVFNIMSYDYSVSDLDDANSTAPNCPLYDPTDIPGPAGGWSVDSTVQGYLAAGVPSSKIMLGTALYGHTWYTPGLAGAPARWQKYNVPATVQGECCGPFKSTYGAKYGDGSNLCGTLMASEIIAKLGSLNGSGNVVLEPRSQTNIGYSSDGVWISFDNDYTLGLKVDYAKKYNLAGVFTFDTSMDTIENGQFTYRLIKGMRSRLGPMPPSPPLPPTPPPTPGPGPSPTPSPPPTPAGCSGKPAGMYCVDPTHFEWCPQGIVESCAPGTTCKQQGSSIQCA